MILQNFVMPGKLNIHPQIYYRVSGEVYMGECGIVIQRGSTFSTDTYMNVFDIGAWKKYTEVRNLILKIKVRGKGKIAVWKEKQNQMRQMIALHDFEREGLKTENETELIINIPENLQDGIVYFEIHAEEDCILASATFEATDSAEHDINISIVICTYKRREQLEQLLEELSSQKKRDMFPWLRIKVIDNASELSNQYGEKIQVYHNPNTGGSGGFSRGMDETVKDIEYFPATHVLLMDDDVTLQIESVYRLYALLSFVKEEYENEVVAGRMFRLDKPHVQYTASEIWNAGDIRHIGWNQDMTERNRLFGMNENGGGEYSGWWFACFPIGFVKENRPLPFFLHCDDVEYGLRHGGTPIILNGIQVWHETYEYRQSPVIEYYDMRNTLIVNVMYGLSDSDKEILCQWKDKITKKHVKKQYLAEYMLILGMWDYLRGKKYLKRHNAEKKNIKLKKKQMRKTENSILWRLTECKYIFKHKQIRKTYQINH